MISSQMLDVESADATRGDASPNNHAFLYLNQGAHFIPILPSSSPRPIFTFSLVCLFKATYLGAPGSTPPT